MTPQLELDLARRRPDEKLRTRLGRGTRGLLGTVLDWAPLWAPAIFLGQLLFLGLVPAQAESERLDRAELDVRQRVEQLRGEEQELRLRSRMLSDEIYRERVRRSLIRADAEPLTLELARSGQTP